MKCSILNAFWNDKDICNKLRLSGFKDVKVFNFLYGKDEMPCRDEEFSLTKAGNDNCNLIYNSWIIGAKERAFREVGFPF